jgi:hypothetical protein
MTALVDAIFKDQFPIVFSNITIKELSPVFKDKTADIQDWDEGINSYHLSCLA